jgi:hypothetical protein
MIEAVLNALLKLASIPDAEGLRSTAPQYLSLEEATVHLSAARKAGAEHDIDPEILLSIAWFESRYDPGVVTREPRRKFSCGVMTPIPRAKRCIPKSVADGYAEGAAHLRTWTDSWRCRGSIRCGLLGYAGGGALIMACKDGQHVVQRGGRDVELCGYIVSSRMARAKRIKRQIEMRVNT